MTAALAFQVVYSAVGLFFASASIRLYGSWAHAGGWYKLALAFVFTCLTVDSLFELIQTVAVQPNRWLVWVLLACGGLLVGLAVCRTLRFLRMTDQTNRESGRAVSPE